MQWQSGSRLGRSGQSIPGYELLECIGEGEMAEVWRARIAPSDGKPP
jgi:hypothetical protein